MNFRLEQRAVAYRMAIAFLSTLVVLTSCGLLASQSEFQPLDYRLGLAIQANVFIALWVTGAIGNVARLRFFSEQDIAGSSSGDASVSVKNANAILQNTLEQAFIALVAILATSCVWPHPAALLIAQIILFSLGRILFFRGYRLGPSGRALGFALTFYPSAVMLMVNGFKILVELIAR